METKQKELIERQAETIVQQQEYLSQLQQLLQESLKLNVVGIGDWRPEKKGKFGKFQVVEWKEE